MDRYPFGEMSHNVYIKTSYIYIYIYYLYTYIYIYIYIYICMVQACGGSRGGSRPGGPYHRGGGGVPGRRPGPYIYINTYIYIYIYIYIHIYIYIYLIPMKILMKMFMKILMNPP